ncbi:MAG: glycosyltransferase family 39 protein [Phycisphaerales bacterium]
MGPSSKPSAAVPPSALTAGRVLAIVAAVAIVARLWVMLSTCLVIENDGVDYFNTAWAHLSGEYEISRFRTPGYPLFLYACFKAFGMGSFGIMFLQHLAGALTAVLVARIGLRLATPPLALLSGILCALDPTLALFGSVMQTECLSIFLLVLAAALALCSEKRPLLGAVALGGVLAIAIMIRPTFQVVAPFFLLAAAAAHGLSRPARGAVLGLGTLALGAGLAGWIDFNRSRGIPGMAEGSGAALWISLVQQDLVDRDYPIPPDLERRYAAVRIHRGASAAMWRFVASAADSPEQQARLYLITKRWALHSIAKDPWAYLKRLPYSFMWQMNAFPGDGFIQDSQITWFSYMVSCDVEDFEATIANFHFDGPVGELHPLAMSGRGGAVRDFYQWWGINHPRGFPQLALAVLALGAGFTALATRNFSLAFVLIASAALVGVHVLMVFHQGRYSLPAMTLWYAVWPVAPLAAVRVLSALSGPEPIARAAFRRPG